MDEKTRGGDVVAPIHERGYIKGYGIDSWEYDLAFGHPNSWHWDLAEEDPEFSNTVLGTFTLYYDNQHMKFCLKEVELIHGAMSKFLDKRKELLDGLDKGTD